MDKVRCAQMLIRLLATMFLVVAIAVVLARQCPKRANAWAGAFAGILMIAYGVARRREPSAEISEILLMQLDARGLRGAISYFWVMLGYGFVFGAIAAMPWLQPSTASQAGNLLRDSLFSWSSWRKTLVRNLLWLVAFAVILLLWRWIGASYR